MATIRLIDQVWLDREYEKVQGVLYQQLGGEHRAGRDSSDLRKVIEYAGLRYYTNPDLAYFKQRLIDDGIIEEVIESMTLSIPRPLAKEKAEIKIPLPKITTRAPLTHKIILGLSYLLASELVAYLTLAILTMLAVI